MCVRVLALCRCDIDECAICSMFVNISCDTLIDRCEFSIKFDDSLFYLSVFCVTTSMEDLSGGPRQNDN